MKTKTIAQWNKQLRGSGYFLVKTKTKIRVESEGGDFLFYKSSVKSFIDWWVVDACRFHVQWFLNDVTLT